MKYVVLCSWDMVPHLTEEAKADLYRSTEPHLREARSKGLPHVGTGQIFPFAEDDIKIKDFPIPPDWPRAFSLDTGPDHNGVVWGAKDPENDIVYIYRVLTKGHVSPATMTAAIHAAGSWIPGVADAASIKADDGRQYIQVYKSLGLNVELPNKAVDTGIALVYNRLNDGRLRVFESCVEWFQEQRLYVRVRTKQGTTKIKDQTTAVRQDLMAATRYLIISGMDRAKVQPTQDRVLSTSRRYSTFGGEEHGWMG